MTDPHPGSAPRGEIKALTGLRAVAATWVVLLHFERFLGPYLDQVPALRTVISAGWTGVELFFVLSGFVVTLSYLERMGRRPSLPKTGRFLYNRVARVWPAWAVVTVVMFAFVSALRAFGGQPDIIEKHPATDVAHLARQLLMVQMWGRSGHGGVSYVMPGWSISAEWSAYLAFPLVVVVAYRFRRLPAAVLFGCAVLAMAPLVHADYVHGAPDWTQNWVPRLACSFAAGAFCALGVRRVHRTPRSDGRALLAVNVSLLAIVLGTFWATWRRGADGDHDYTGVIVALFPVLVSGLALTDRGPARLLAVPGAVYAGRISYCLYLVHYLILDIAVTIAWQDPAARGRLTPGLEMLLPALIGLAFLAAAGLHHGVEEPVRRLMLRGLQWPTSEARPWVRRRPAVVGEVVGVAPAHTTGQPRPRAVRSASGHPRSTAAPAVPDATGRWPVSGLPPVPLDRVRARRAAGSGEIVGQLS